MTEHDRGQVAASAAEIYEEFFVPALFVDWPARVLAAADVQPGNDVLDVACGTGVLAREAIALVGSEGSVVGVDINPGMLAIAEQKAPAPTWKLGPAEALPFADHAFDRVVSQFGLMFFENQTQALAEMMRVVRPGGIVAVAVWGLLDETPGYAAVAAMLDELFGSEVAKSIQAPYSLGDVDELARLLTDAGIETGTIQTMRGKARFASVDAWIYTDIKGWTLADVIDDAGFARLKQAAPQRLAPFVRADGSVEFDAPAHIITIPA